MTRLRTALLALCFLGAFCAAQAQELKRQPTPFSVWLDFPALSSPNIVRTPLPIWLENITSESLAPRPGSAAATVYRLRLRRLGHLNKELLLRVFFDDQPGTQPIVTGWSETGRLAYSTEPLGKGAGVPNSETLIVPAADLDYIDVEIPGDGSSIRGLFLATLVETTIRRASDFEPSARLADPFGNAPAAKPPYNDQLLFGRVRATLDETHFRLDASTQEMTVSFELDAAPLLARAAFEIAGADPLRPPRVSVNGSPTQPVNISFPDLADPGYHGSARALDAGLRFRYTGWLPAQIAIPGNLLSSGSNKITFTLSNDSEPLAVRSLILDLKHPWRQLDYELHP